MVVLDQFLYGDQILFYAQFFDFMVVSETDMERFHGFQLFSNQPFVSCHIQRIKILLSSSHPQESQGNRIFYGGHGNDRKFVKNRGITMSEGDSGKAFICVLCFQGVREERVAELTRSLRLEEAGKKSVWKLSGGMRKKVEVGKILIQRPPVAIFDEPTSNLDPEMKNLIWDFFNSLE